MASAYRARLGGDLFNRLFLEDFLSLRASHAGGALYWLAAFAFFPDVRPDRHVDSRAFEIFFIARKVGERIRSTLVYWASFDVDICKA